MYYKGAFSKKENYPGPGQYNILQQAEFYKRQIVKPTIKTKNASILNQFQREDKSLREYFTNVTRVPNPQTYQKGHVLFDNITKSKGKLSWRQNIIKHEDVTIGPQYYKPKFQKESSIPIKINCQDRKIQLYNINQEYVPGPNTYNLHESTFTHTVSKNREGFIGCSVYQNYEL